MSEAQEDSTTPARHIGVLVVDGSATQRALTVHLLTADPDLHIVGTATNGEEAISHALRARPDVILMDIHLAGISGYDTARQIMETNPVPIVICSATADVEDAAVAMPALEAGAVACVPKPLDCSHPNFERDAERMRLAVKLMSEVRVVTRRPKSMPKPGRRHDLHLPMSGSPVEVVGIGASTGGPPVIQSILGGLPSDFPVPIVIVQHIAEGFLAGMASWLAQTSGFPVQIAAPGEVLAPRRAYFAPEGFHLGVHRGGRVQLSSSPPDHGLRPSVSHLFRSLANEFGPAAVGVLLTGMGRDGAAELRMMRDYGACTIAQDLRTSVVHGMPGEAIALGGASVVLPAERIAEALVTVVKRSFVTAPAKR